MGGCVSADADNGGHSVNTKKGQKETEVNLILLGTHQSGKTTIARQLMLAYNGQISDMERQHLLSIIHNNIITAIQTLCLEAHIHGSISIDAEDAFQYFIGKCNNDSLDDLVVSWVRKLWNEQSIRATFEHRHDFYLRNPHNVQYFLDKLTDVTRPDYVPTDEDIIRVAIRTTAFNTISFHFGGLKVNLNDLGGLRSERPRWPQRLAHYDAVLFVVNISEFDERLHEDKQILRLQESIRLFGDLARSGYFQGLPVVLIFTHSDIFEDKIQARNLSTYFPDYTGASHDSNEAKEWITSKFTTVKQPSGEPINLTVCHINSLEQEQVKKCVNSILVKPTVGSGQGTGQKGD